MTVFTSLYLYLCALRAVHLFANAMCNCKGFLRSQELCSIKIELMHCPMHMRRCAS